ncbi:MAG: lipopolysaccharide biosynthesis protein [Pseudomonadota bacterium]
MKVQKLTLMQKEPLAQSNQSANDQPMLGAKVASGAGLMVAARFLMRLFGFLNTIIVARLLAPDDFGIVAIGVTAMQLLQNLSDISVGSAVVKFRDADRKDIDTLFTLSMIRGVVIALFLVGLAPLMGLLYEDPRVTWIFLGVALYPLFIGFVNPSFYEFERDLDFSKEFVVLITNKLAGVVVSIAIAVIFRTYWAIILGLATNAFVQLILSYWIKPYRPRLTFASFNKLIGFTGWLTGVSFMAALNNKLDALILARIFPARVVGNFYVGLQLADLPTTELAYPISRAIFPGLSSLQHDLGQMRRAFLKGVEAMAFFALPAGIGFALVGQEIIYLLLGAKWNGAVPVLEIMAPAVAIHLPFMTTQQYAMARGMTRLVFLREFVFFLIRTPIFIWAALNHGFIGAVWTSAAMNLVHVALNLALYARVSGRSALEAVWAIRRSAGAVAIMVASYLLIFPQFVPFEALPLILRLGVNVALAACVYVGTHWVLWRAEGSPNGVERLVMEALAGAFRRFRPS